MNAYLIIGQREGSSLASTWTEYLCLSKGELKPYKLFTGQYECLAELNDYYDEELEDYVLPEQIDGQSVAGIEDDYVVGGELQQQDETTNVEFASVFDTELRTWLEETGWAKLVALPSIEKAIAGYN